jgi:hypothetical protein
LESCIKTITIGFSKSKKILPIGSLILRAYMGTPYSHVYLKFYSETLNRELIYEAVGSGVRFIGTKQWEKHAVEVDSFEVDLINGNYVSLLQYCIDHTGTDYGVLQNLGVPLASIFKLDSNPFQSGTNCSEEIYKILLLSGYSNTKKKDLVTPKDIHRILSESQN